MSEMSFSRGETRAHYFRERINVLERERERERERGREGETEGRERDA